MSTRPAFDPTELESAHRHRIELTGFCYRMLGCAFDAEDAVQETLERAWRHHDRFDPSVATRRTWLFAIARNVCIDMLRGRVRRTRPVLAGGPSRPGSELGRPRPEHWVTPVPDEWVIDPDGDPAAIIQRRASIRLAFTAALQVLPPRQRAVLILKDVMAWESGEIAELLATSPQAVNSALQRARGTLAGLDVTDGDVRDPDDPAQAELIERFIRAFEADDVNTLVTLMATDAAMTMPPFAWWLRGRDAIRVAMQSTDACRGSRLLQTAASGSPALAQYRSADGDGWLRPWSLIVLDVRAGQITEMTSWLDAERLFAALRLPARIARSAPEPDR